MKYIELEESQCLPEGSVADDTLFSFDCNPGVSCFNLCCHNLNLFLYPYDVIRLKQHLGLSSDAFLEKHVDVVLRKDCFFPEVLLSMSELADKALSVSVGFGLFRLFASPRSLPHVPDRTGTRL